MKRTSERVVADRLHWDILWGGSTGLNVVGALQLARELGSGHTVMTVAVDSGLEYLVGDLYS